MTDETKKPGLFDFRANLKTLITVLALIAIAGWYFGFGPDDVGDVAKSIATAHKPNLPVSVKYRESLVGKGYVVMIKNESDNRLSVNLVLRNTGSTQKKTGSIDIEAGRDVSIGWMEGWQFQHDDVLTLSHKDFMTGVYSIR